LKLELVFSLASVIIFLGVLPVFAQTTETSDKVVVLHTQSGDMVIELFPNDAPKTAANFLNLTEHHLYDKTVFHRVIKDFMIQGGDPKSKPGASKHFSEWGTGDAGYTIPGEFNTIKHKRGIVSMARGSDPDSASSQFFIVHKDSFFLDQNYAAFGRLATNTSYETLDKIANLTTGGEQLNNRPLDFGKGEILKAEIKKRTDITDLLDLGEPERIESFTSQDTQEYSTEKFDISFLAPAGWLVQEPPQKTPSSPDIVAVGPKIAGFLFLLWEQEQTPFKKFTLRFLILLFGFKLSKKFIGWILTANYLFKYMKRITLINFQLPFLPAKKHFGLELLLDYGFPVILEKPGTNVLIGQIICLFTALQKHHADCSFLRMASGANQLRTACKLFSAYLNLKNPQKVNLSTAPKFLLKIIQNL